MQAKEMPKNAISCVDELIMRKLKEEESTVGPSKAQLEAKKKATGRKKKTDAPEPDDEPEEEAEEEEEEEEEPVKSPSTRRRATRK